jgi:hypothetical protein
MRRVLAMMATAALLIAGGCGSKSYDERLARTLDEMRYRKRLDENLMPPVTGNKFDQVLQIYLRPPKNLDMAKEFQLTQVEPGKFDLEATFLEPEKQSLHVLARYKPKSVAKKKGAPTPADTAVRGDFVGDVLALVNTVYPTVELAPNKLKSETKKKPTSAVGNDYKWTTFTVDGKNVQIWFYKKSDYDVALIFEYPTAQQASLFPKIGLCLESFAVGEKARRQFAGQGTEEEAAPGAAGGAVAF